MGRIWRTYREKVIELASSAPEERPAAIRRTLGRKAHRKVLELQQQRATSGDDPVREGRQG